MDSNCYVCTNREGILRVKHVFRYLKIIFIVNLYIRYLVYKLQFLHFNNK